MNVVVGWMLANSILKIAFDEKIYIKPAKLNCLVYLVYSNYLYSTGKSLFNEEFVKTKEGPILPSIHMKFGSYRSKSIKNFATSFGGLVLNIVCNDDCFISSVFYIWNCYKYVDDDELVNFINNSDAVLNSKNDYIFTDYNTLDEKIKRYEEGINTTKNFIRKTI